MVQQSLFSPATGPELRDKGIRKARATAEKYTPGWSEMALAALKRYTRLYPFREFQTEDVRQWAHAHGLPDANGRAWGSVIVAAKKQNLIRLVGYARVSNAKAHCTPAAVWMAACDLDGDGTLDSERTGCDPVEESASLSCHTNE